MLVPPGESPDFLASFPVSALERPDLADLLRRLGIRTLGAFAALPAADVLARFGPDGALAHRLARGLDDRPLRPAHAAARPHLLHRVGPAGRTGRPRRLRRPPAGVRAARGTDQARVWPALRIAIEAETEHGETLLAAVAARRRAHAGDDRRAGALAGRRLAQPTRHGPTGRRAASRSCASCPTRSGPTTASRAGSGVATPRRRRPGARAHWHVCRECSGPRRSSPPRHAGGRGPAEQVRLIPWGDARPIPSPTSPRWRRGRARCRRPRRTVVPPSPHRHRRRRQATARRSVSPAAGAVTATPAARWATSTSPAGPGRGRSTNAGGTPPAHRRRARFQLATADGGAYLVAVEGGRWFLEAAYD